MAGNVIDANVDAKQIMNRVTMQIKIGRMNEFRVRAAIGVFLIKLAALIMWCNIEVEDNADGVLDS